MIPSGAAILGDSRRWASTRVRPRQQGSTGSSTRHRATALADTLRKGGACGERWTGRIGLCATGHGGRPQGQALVAGAQPSSPANPHGRRPHRHEHDRRLTWNTTHLYDLARQRAGGELVQRHHGAQAALEGTFDHAWVWATVAREGSPGVGSIRAHSMFAQAPLRFTPRPRRGPSSVSDEWALHRHGMRSSWRSMPSSSLLPHRSTSFPSANLLICMPR